MSSINPDVLKLALAQAGVEVTTDECVTFKNILEDVLKKKGMLPTGQTVAAGVAGIAAGMSNAEKLALAKKQYVANVLKGQTPTKTAGLTPTKTAKGIAKSILDVTPHTAVPVSPVATQKAKGVLALIKAGLLSQGMAHVATNLEAAILAYESLTGPVFVRPCPETPRHGFVDSRVCKDKTEVQAVFAEMRKVDPKSELILMPFIKADHNMIWRPGMLSIGPGHDGATAGHDSLAITVQDTYPDFFTKLCKTAGVNLDKSDPFIEAVSSEAHQLVLTQVRAGTKGAPTTPDWCPNDAYLVTDVYLAGGDLLDWETTAVALGKKIKLDPESGAMSGPVVYHPGGNQGSHYAVHAQLWNVPVLISFEPSPGQVLDKLGIDLPALDPDAIVWGFLGGLLSPSLLPVTNRHRAVAAAMAGAHHGLRMGGPSGVCLGASVAMMLRLGQAALWGEARHKESKGLSRDQVYKTVLDSWEKGRAGLGAKTTLFQTGSWQSGFGGKAWAACGHATIDLDRAMLTLIQEPTEDHAKAIVASLNTIINLAHNNGWWMNKFGGTTELFNQGAALDPRPLLLAAPVWYQASLADPDQRMALLGRIQAMTAITVAGGLTAPTGKVMTPGTPSNKNVVSDGAVSIPTPGAMAPGQIEKVGGFDCDPGSGGIPIITLDHKPIAAQCKGPHVQIKLQTGGYVSGELPAMPPMTGAQTNLSYSGSGIPYHVLTIHLTPTLPNMVHLLAGAVPVATVKWL